jgi:hypothetical protein
LNAGPAAFPADPPQIACRSPAAWKRPRELS